MSRTITYLNELPGLAAEVYLTKDAPNPVGSPARSGVTPWPPPPANLDALDCLRVDAYGLLYQLTTCVKAVWEECRATRDVPALTNPPTWVGETSWLIETRALWESDEFLCDLVRFTVSEVHRALSQAARVPPPVRLVCTQEGCGLPIHSRDHGSYFQCEAGHVIDHWAEIRRLGQLLTVTASEAAVILGVKASTIRKWRQRRKIRAAGTRNAMPIYRVEDIRQLAARKIG